MEKSLSSRFSLTGLGWGQKLKKLSFKELVLLLLVSYEERGYKLKSHSTEIHYI